MRAVLASTAVVAMTILAVSGCRSGGNTGNWNLPWSRKNAGMNHASHGSQMSGPELPSNGASPEQVAPNAYDYNAPPQGNYDQAGGYPGASGYGAPANNNPYPAPPPSGAYGDPSGGYGAAGGNGAAGAQTAATGGYPPPANAYPPPANAYPQAGQGAYDAQANMAPAQADTAAPQANTVAPQTAPYGAGSAQPPAAAYGAAPQQSGAAPQTAAAAPYRPGSTSVSNNGSGYIVTNPYATGGAANATAGAQPPDRYAPSPQSSDGYQMADGRNAAGYGATQSEQAAADRYASSNDGTGSGAGGAASEGSSARDYEPGNTGYNPGQTGYSPPGTAAYQPPGSPNVVSTARRDPYYRPGGTSDYLPSNNSQAPAGSTDRYGVPSTAAAPGGWPQ